MSENINLRPISELPEVESVSVGDKFLLNSGGEAKLIDASKMGGGGGTIYAELEFATDSDSDNIARVYADEAHSNMLTYDQAKEKLKSGAALIYADLEVTAVVTPLTIIYRNYMKSFIMLAYYEGVVPFIVLCADSIT